MAIFNFILLSILLIGNVSHGYVFGSNKKRNSLTSLRSDLVDTASKAGNFKSLSKYLSESGLANDLKKGQHTLFAPTDEAWSKISVGMKEMTNDDTKLRNLLKYHLIEGKLMSSSVLMLDQKKVSTENVNADLKFTVNAIDGIKVDDANVIATDILCDNGVIHVIDKVLTPDAQSRFNPVNEAGVTEPLMFWDPLDICPKSRRLFSKYRESELKHGRIAMLGDIYSYFSVKNLHLLLYILLAYVGIFVGERYPFLVGNFITGPAIYHFQQADLLINAFTANVVGFILAVEGYNIVNGWETPSETLASGDTFAALKQNYIAGDINFDPLNLCPKSPENFKRMRTKELNNGRLAMIAVFMICVRGMSYYNFINSS